MARTRLRLTGIVIQATGLLDNGNDDDLTPVTHDAATLTVTEFREYVASGRFDDEVKKWEQVLLAGRNEANREQRRTKAKAKPRRSPAKRT